MRAAGRLLLDLSASNPTTVLSSYPHSAIAEAYGAMPTFAYRPDPAGMLSARVAVAGSYQVRGCHVHPEQVLLTASTSEAYGLLFKLLCDPGDEILVPVPSYPLFDYLAALESVRTVPYHLRFDGGWFVDLDDIAQRVSARTRALVVVSPHNPTGSFLKTGEARRLLEWAQSRSLPVIADEVFLDYRFSSDAEIAVTLAAFPEAVSFCLNGLSKTAGMPQLKLGWIVVNGPEPQRQLALERLELLLDTYLSVSTPVQACLPQLLAIGDGIRGELQASILQNLPAANEEFRESPVTPLPVEGGWSLLLRLPHIMSEEAWITGLLQQQSVLVQPGYFFDMPSEPFLVLSLITPPAIFREGLRRIRQHVHGAIQA